MMTGIDGVRERVERLRRLCATPRRKTRRCEREVQTLQVRLQEERAEASVPKASASSSSSGERAGVETVAAEVIAGPARADFRDMTIDKGSLDGVDRDMAVISPAGVVGRVISVEPSRRACADAHRSQRRGRRDDRTHPGPGSGGGRAGRDAADAVRPVHGGSDHRDRVVTSGIDKVYPKGFVIGTVASVARGTGTFHELTIQPAVDFTRLEEVLVMTTPPPAVTAEQIAREAEALANARRQAQMSQNASPRAASPPAGAPLPAAPRM